MMGTGFLGNSHSPKWYKLNNYNYKNSNLCPNLVTKQNINIIKAGFNNINLKSSLGIRYNSTSSTTTSISLISGVSFNLKSEINKEDEEITLNINKVGSSHLLIDFLREKNLKPIFFYDNLQLDSIRKKILIETKNLSGIYLILNKVTLDYYIGSAATNRFYARFSNHLLNFHGSKILKLAVKKYKLSQFAFIILELFPEVVNKYNNKKLLDLEDFYLKSLLPNYNILTEAGSSFGYKHTEISRIKMKANYSQERREKIGNLNRGKSLSKDTIEKIKSINRVKPLYSEQAILNMKRNSKAIILYNRDNTVYGEYSSITVAANSIGCSDKTIRRALQTDKKILKRRWIVNYV